MCPKRSIPPLFRTIYVVNAKGSGVNEKKCSWSFTVDATIYTFAPIDTRRLGAMADVSHTLSEWLIDEFGFRNTSFNTVGGEINAKVSSESSKGLGIYFCQVDVEDVTMAKGDYRSGRDLALINAHMLDESCQPKSYSVKNCSLVPRLAPDLRVHISETIRKAIIKGLKRWFKSVARR